MEVRAYGLVGAEGLGAEVVGLGEVLDARDLICPQRLPQQRARQRHWGGLLAGHEGQRGSRLRLRRAGQLPGPIG